jgi:putative ABC transport system permease protein
MPTAYRHLRSSQANLLAQIDVLGTDLLTVSPEPPVLGGQAQLDPSAVGKIAHLAGVSDAVALLVAGVGLANVMIISVIERRGEIGLRRALGATRRDIGAQFLTESLVLCLIGGSIGSALGFAVTAAYATANKLPVVLSVPGLGGGIGGALVIGAVAGVYPGLRAAALAPTEALRAI